MHRIDTVERLLLRTAGEWTPSGLIRFLLEKGANPNLTDHQGETPVIALASWRQSEGIEIGREEDGARAIAILADYGADLDRRRSDGTTALMQSAGYHDLVLKALLDAGANVDIRDLHGCTALAMAADFGSCNAIQYLLKAGAQVGIVEAIALEDMPRIRTLLAGRVDLSARGADAKTLLMIAARKGRLDLVQILLQRGADVNARDRYGRTALMLAIAEPPSGYPLAPSGWEAALPLEGRTEIVQALLSRHADPNRQDEDHATALSIAQQIDNKPILALLKLYGAKSHKP